MYSGPGPEYDDPANCAPEEDQYGSQYGGPYGTPYDHYGSRGSMGRRSVGRCQYFELNIFQCLICNAFCVKFDYLQVPPAIPVATALPNPHHHHHAIMT